MAHDYDEDEDSPDLSKIIEKVNSHVNSRIEFMRLSFSEKTAIVVSKLGTVSLVIGLFLLFFLFTNIAAAFWIGKRLDDYSMGFGLVSLFYLLLIIIYLLFRRSFENKIQDVVVNALYPEKDEEDEDE